MNKIMLAALAAGLLLMNAQAAPTVTITATPPQVAAAGDATVLEWSAPGATSCRMTGSGPGGGWNSDWPTSGTDTAYIQATHTFALSCVDAAGATGEARVMVTIAGQDPFTAGERAATCGPYRFAYRASLKRLYYGCQWADTLERETRWTDLTAAQFTKWKATGSTMMGARNLNPVVLPAPSAEVQVTTLCDRYWLWAEDEGARAPKMTRARKLSQNGCK